VGEHPPGGRTRYEREKEEGEVHVMGVEWLSY